MSEWIKGTAKRECDIDAMVEVVMMHGATQPPTPVLADHVAWRDVERWRLAPVCPPMPDPGAVSDGPYTALKGALIADGRCAAGNTAALCDACTAAGNTCLPTRTHYDVTVAPVGIDWIDWTIGYPQPFGAMVDIETRSGARETGLPSSFHWGEIGADTIVRYRAAGGWVALEPGVTPDPDRLVDVIHNDGTALYNRVHQTVNWANVRDWRYAAGVELDWIKWTGGACPVERDALVEFKTRDGHVGTDPAKSLRWEHFPASSRSDIVAYRLAGATGCMRECQMATYRTEAVAEHDRLTEIIRLKDIKLAEAYTAQHTAELRAAELEEQLRKRDAELDLANRELTVARAGADGANALQRLFLATAEVREARAMREHASVKLDRAMLLEQIASGISRGHLPYDFYAQLQAATK